MKVIPAADSHLPEMIEIWREFMDFHSDLDPFLERREDGHEHFEKYVREKIDSDDAKVLVATDDGKVIGFSIIYISNHPPVLKTERYGHIDSLAVINGDAGGRISRIVRNALATTPRWRVPPTARIDTGHLAMSPVLSN